MKQWSGWMLALAVAIGGTACGGADTGGEGSASESKAAPEAKQAANSPGLDERQQRMFKSASDNFEKAKQKLADGTPGKALFGCSMVIGTAEQLAGVDDPKVKALISEAPQFCGYELPLAAAEGEVAKAEAAQKATPGEPVGVECLSADYIQALDTLKKAHADDEKVTAIEERWAAVCPATS